MLSRIATSFAARAQHSPAFAKNAAAKSLARCSAPHFRAFSATADDAWKFSGYQKIDFTIKEDATVYEAVQKFAGFGIGCLIVTDAAGKKQWKQQ